MLSFALDAVRVCHSMFSGESGRPRFQRHDVIRRVAGAGTGGLAGHRAGLLALELATDSRIALVPTDGVTNAGTTGRGGSRAAAH